MGAPGGAPVGAPAGAAWLDSPAAITAALGGKTVHGRYAGDGEPYVEYHLGDGRTAYWEKGCTYPGTWWAEQGMVCYAYPNYRGGAPNCFLLFRLAAGGVAFYQVAEDGSIFLSSESPERVAEGNDAHLPVGGTASCVGV